MNLSKRAKAAAMLGLALIAGITADLIYRVLKPQPDPQGISRRNPHSMYAHQGEWASNCQDGRNTLQSPINITTTQMSAVSNSPLKITPFASSADLIDVGHTFQLRYSSSNPGAKAEFEGGVYDLRQFHFHKPSEHLVDGKQYEMEAHFVFFNTNKHARTKAIAVGVFILDGPQHAEIEKIWKHLPPMREGYGEGRVELVDDWSHAAATNELKVDSLDHHEKILATGLDFSLNDILPKKSDFIVYDGSLTTPSCDEGITHLVSLTPIYMQHEQVEHFEGYYEGTNRDIQPIGDAKVRRFRRASF